MNEKNMEKRQAGKMRSGSSFLIFSFSPLLLIFLSLIFLSACSELEKPKTEPFYAQTAPPPKQEFRWSNGKMPKSFDPALASAPPETDVVRAVFEGLTDTDPKTLTAVPAIAVEWSSSDDNKIWTFKLRRDAKWSNGRAVTAEDFVRSWKRLGELGAKVSHRDLLKNIVGMPVETESETPIPANEDSDLLLNSLANQNLSILKGQSNSEPSAANTPKNSALVSADANANKDATDEKKLKAEPKPETRFGVEAVGEHVLKVSLIEPDKDFPLLAAHPIFRPIYGDGKDFEIEKLNAGVVTNGAFRIVSVGQDGVTLDRSEHYWNNKEIKLERVKFVPAENAEKALEAYRAGELDAVTNVNFEPLALKLLQPYDDFRRTTHSALNFYEFNRKNAPFSDRRVREALAISIERERLTEGEMEGATKPALGFLPFDEKAPAESKLTQDNEKAKQLLAEAGFPGGENFPVVRLIVNRNETQQKIARSVAKMWKSNLNVETEIIVKEAAEVETTKKTGDFDVLRRGVVLPTADETANMLTIFEPKKRIVAANEKDKAAENKTADKGADNKRAPGGGGEPPAAETPIAEITEIASAGEKDAMTEILETENGELILTEEAAIFELSAIPLYFPTSYSLVKPYVQGFEMNTLDAPSLKSVRIDNNWQPKKQRDES